MPALGQTQKSGCSPRRSASPSITDIIGQAYEVRKPPRGAREPHRCVGPPRRYRSATGSRPLTSGALAASAGVFDPLFRVVAVLLGWVGFFLLDADRLSLPVTSSAMASAFSSSWWIAI